MKIIDKHRFHGAALAQIVESQHFTALNPAPDGVFGHYVVNHDRELFVKYRTTTLDNKPAVYRFTFSPEEMKRYVSALERDRHLYLVLVCGQHTVLALSRQQLQLLLDLASGTSQWLEVSLKVNHSPRVRGSGDPSQTVVVPHTSCPNQLFKA